MEDNKNIVEEAPSKKLISYRYNVLNLRGKKETGIFDAESLTEVKNFLLMQDYKIISIEVKKSYDIELFTNVQLKSSVLAFSLTQLATYIRAGIPLVDSVKILSKQSVDAKSKKAFAMITHELLKGESFSNALSKQDKIFPSLLINMIKTAEMTGDLPSVLDDMADYYMSMERTRKQMISAMTYPSVVMIAAVGVLIFMLVYLVPQFVSMFESQNAELPFLTVLIMNTSDFIRVNYLLLIGIITFIVGSFMFSYKKVKSFRIAVQTFTMKLPVFKNIIIYNEVANFTKTFASLLNHGVFITDSMEILGKITKNEIYIGIIDRTMKNLAKGENISKSFKGEWAFPIVAYEMLVTGETTGQLGLMMEKVADHFQSLHKTMVDQLKSLIEPMMIAGLAVIVGIILLAIITPMFEIYNQIQ